MKQIMIKQQPLSYEMREELKTLRTNILFCGKDKKKIVVTSCFAGEGKSMISLNLAKSLAELKKKVILIDADVRRSVLAKVLDISEVKYGLTHFLSGQCVLENAILQTDFMNLDLIVAGPEVPNPTELLSTDNFRAMLERFEETYDYIIIDSPPLGVVVDASIIAKECDGAIFTIEAANVKYRMAQQVKEKLEKSGCPILGTVLNKVDRKQNRGYYNKYYGKKYSRYYTKEYKRNIE